MLSQANTETSLSPQAGALREFLALHETGNTARARALFCENVLFVWFNIEAPTLRIMLDEIVRKDTLTRDAAFGVHLFLSFMQAGKKFDPTVYSALPLQAAPHSLALPAAYAFELRLHGQVVEAREHSNRMFRQPALIQPFVDSGDGWAQLIALQRGITAMLAGELSEALHFFQEAQTRATTSGLEFLLRDSLCKSALIHAAFGDPVEAEILLQRAARLPQSSSWVEPVIDVTAQLAEVLLEPKPAAASILLSHIEESLIGEMWPFYVHARYRVCEAAGAHSKAAKTLARYKALPFLMSKARDTTEVFFHSQRLRTASLRAHRETQGFISTTQTRVSCSLESSGRSRKRRSVLSKRPSRSRKTREKQRFSSDGSIFGEFQ